ncbi:polysialyltransferase family glycosyltransferase [Providencia huaxiensis]|uniref:polysialyltransferase family glycosyltransferase n=1 Tax=Providencia huaxiensis TaxID=2027290 RepID=UPI000C7F5139|nr:polysialyltransferase family glycosyltransferase [Providencia huaxiensis]AXH63519.1 hypothetical protein CYG50_16650 [Providencia huaxiensis]
MRALVGINITSPYQLLSFISYYEENKAKYSKFIIFKYDYWGHNQIYKRYLDYFIKIGGEIIENITNLNSIINYLNHEINQFNFDFISVNQPLIQLKYRFKKSNLIVISDGLGYYGDYSSLISSLKRERRSFISQWSLSTIKIKYLLKKILFKTIKFEEYTLLRYSDLSPNKNFIDNFKNTVLKLNGNSHIETPSLVFLDQPLVELGFLSENEYSLLIRSIYNYSKSLGLNFFIKMHPSSVKESAEYNTLKFDGILEELCILNKNIKHVISYSSTGLFNILYLSDDIKVEKVNSDAVMSKKQNKIFEKIHCFTPKY